MSVAVAEVEFINPINANDEEKYRLFNRTLQTPNIALSLETIRVGNMALPVLRVTDVKRADNLPRYVPMSNIKWLKYEESK